MKRIFWGMIFVMIMLVTACQERKGGGLTPKATFNLRDEMDKRMEGAAAWSEAIKEKKVEMLLEQNANRVTLAESERLKYHSWNGLGFMGYAYYEDILILDDNEIYRQEEGRWKKEGTLEEYLGLKDIRTYIQFKQYLIVEYGVENQLLLVDMEDWTYKTLVGIRLDYYIHEGRLFYSSEEGMIMQLELLEGKPEQHEIYRTGEISEGFISHFAIREDGSMVVVKRVDDGEVEYWLWEKNETEQWNEKKMMIMPDDWQYVYTFDYNQRGFIVEVHPYNTLEEEKWTINSSHGAIQESGEIQEVDIPLDWALPIDDSYFTLESVDRIIGKTPTVVLRYDYEGNKIAEYMLCEQEIIELGFQFRHLIYEDGKLTGFYEHELTGELYIAQISI